MKPQKSEFLQFRKKNEVAIELISKRALRVVMNVQLQSLQSNSRESGGLLGRYATLPSGEEESSSSGFEKPEGSWKRM